MHVVHPSDLTGRARIRQAAMQLFAEVGFEAASVRSIAKRADVSPALVTHHFGSKAKLRAEVDDEVMRIIDEAFGEVSMDEPPQELIGNLGAISARLFGSDDVLRGYLRHTLLADRDTGWGLYHRILEGTRTLTAKLDEANLLRPEVDREWVPVALLFFTLGPLTFEHLLPADAFAPEVLARRSATHQQILLHGLLRSE